MFAVFLSYGFRPFFFGASLYAAVIIPLWLAIYTGVIPIEIPSPISSWHSHEMIFGFVAAAAAGFILTAMPNWTRTKPLQGKWLGALFLLWLAGRVAMLSYFSFPTGVSAAIDISFLLVLTSFIARQLIVSGNYRNLVICAIFAILSISNILIHMEFIGVIDWGALLGQRMAVDSVLLLIIVLGGRVVPAFTRNWLNANGHQVLLPGGRLVDKISIASMLALLILNIVIQDSFWIGLVAVFAGVVNFFRLSTWHGLKTLSQPLLWVLHVAYFWLCISLLLKGATAFSDNIPESLNLHAAGIGAAGTMIGAIMARASLGHSGRALVAPKGISVAYIFITLAGVMRILTELGDWITPAYLLNITALFWVIGFGLITIIFTPILLGPNK